MLRTALKPRWVALLVVVLVAATGMAMLGNWQFRRSESHHDSPLGRAAAPVALSDVLTARETFPARDADAIVTASGTWDGAHQLLVTSRRENDRTAFWVLTPLRLPDGSAVAVVRGWVASPDEVAAAPPSGEVVTVTGSLRPGEPAVDRAPGQTSGLPSGQVDRIDLTALIRAWPYPLLTGYVAQTAQTPAPASPSPQFVPARPEDGGGFDLRSFSYGIQWWAFAGCGLFLWWRLVRDDQQGGAPNRRAPGAEGEPPVGDDEPMSPAARGAHP